MANQENYIRFHVRIPPELNEAIENAAKENKHSKNAEIIQRLERSFEGMDVVSEGGLFIQGPGDIKSFREFLAAGQRFLEQIEQEQKNKN